MAVPLGQYYSVNGQPATAAQVAAQPLTGAISTPAASTAAPAAQANVGAASTAAVPGSATPTSSSSSPATAGSVATPESAYANSYVYGQGYNPQLTGQASIYGQTR